MTFYDFQLAGRWNASTNNPPLKSGKGERGQIYQVSVPGSTVLDDENDWAIDDLLYFDGDAWKKLNSSGSSYQQLGDGAVRMTTQLRIQQNVHVREFGAIGQPLGSSGPSQTEELRAALYYACWNGFSLEFGPGEYLTDTEVGDAAALTVDAPIKIFGAGSQQTWINPLNMQAGKAVFYIECADIPIVGLEM